MIREHDIVRTTLTHDNTKSVMNTDALTKEAGVAERTYLEICDRALHRRCNVGISKSQNGNSKKGC